MFRIRDIEEVEFAEVVQLEEACGLNSRGIAGFRKKNDAGQGWILIGAFQNPLDAGGMCRLLGIFCGSIVVDEFQIDNLAVDAAFRRMGIAHTLLEKGLAKASAIGGRIAFLEVRESNKAAIHLYTRNDFSIAGRRIAYYNDPREDALILTRTLTT